MKINEAIQAILNSSNLNEETEAIKVLDDLDNDFYNEAMFDRIQYQPELREEYDETLAIKAGKKLSLFRYPIE